MASTNHNRARSNTTMSAASAGTSASSEGDYSSVWSESSDRGSAGADSAASMDPRPLRSPSSSQSPFNEDIFRTKIPYAPTSAEYNYYARLIPVLRARKPSDKPRILVITDIDQDYDDLMAIVFLAEMHRIGVVELAGFVANHKPAIKRAFLLRSTLHLLKLGHLPVAVGTGGVEKDEHRDSFFYELKNVTFADQPWNKQEPPSGADLMESLARRVDQGEQPLTVLLISSLQDISEFFNTRSPSFIKKGFKKFVSQGGYTVTVTPPPESSIKLDPVMGMANNNFHPTAARNYTDMLGDLNLPSDAWSREAAKAARLDGSVFQSLSSYGPIGQHFLWSWLRQEFKFYWDPLHNPYMEHLNLEWYLKTRLVLDPDSEEFSRFMNTPPDFKTIVPMNKVIAYDGCAAMGAVGDDVMRALGIMDEVLPAYNTAAHQHRVFGASKDDLGGVDGVSLGAAFKVFFLGGLLATHKYAESIIPAQTVRHEISTYSVDLDTFHAQLPYLAPWKALKAKAKALGAAGDIWGQRRAEGEADKLKAEKLNAKFPKVPDVVPYELLYQEAMGGSG
ncbi:hypothetical protein B0T25DRAFT_548880 [Lasiosphaeria hispida]|uniref:Inosine/uridine-preferring nucleoside hydrolase domain-containing protein n=1 Tax=Lasiosphaeria hispida TaxID=260671 RepID=A0AAJ0HFP8_9PEZI|nr:hypothetical protein B0T25DRAFT_548880 [Lasiosphaeria hispida]